MGIRMTLETMKYSDLARSNMEQWASVFEVADDCIYEKGHMPRTLLVTRPQVLTAKLKITVEFFRVLDSKAFQILPGQMCDMGSVLDVFCTLATFDNLARSRFGGLKDPSFWMRDRETRKLSPVISLKVAADLVGMSPSTLRVSMVPLIKDRAIEFVRAPNDEVGIRVMDGFINDCKFKVHRCI